MMTSLNSSRVAAAALACFTLVALLAQSIINVQATMESGMSLGASIWRLTGYFTILTNSLIMVSMAAIAWSSKGSGIFPNHSLTALTFYITAVGIIYHLLLSKGRNLTGLDYYSDLGVHYIVPALTLAWWLAFAPKSDVRFNHAVLWLSWPLLYTCVALVRGFTQNWYPYFFLDAGRFGLAQVSINVLGLGLGFLIMGSMFVILAKTFSGLAESQSSELAS